MLNIQLTGCLFKLKENDLLQNVPEIFAIKTVKNRKTAFQIVLISDEDCAIRTDRSLYYRQKCDNPAYRLEIEGGFVSNIYLEGFMKDDDGIPKSDILFEDNFLELDSGKARAVWVDLDIPDDAESGVVTIKLYRSVMFSDETLYINRSLNVEVINYTLPDSRDFKFYLDLWQHCSNIARTHGVAPYGGEHFKILEKYVESLAYLGQKAVTVIASEIPWSGQSCYESKTKANLYEYSMIKVTKHKNGKFSYDFSALQKYVELCRKHGIDREISVYGLANVWKGKAEYGFEKPAADYPDQIRVRYYDKNTNSFRFMREASEIDGYVKAIQDYFVRAGLIEKVRIAADEPGDLEAYDKSLTRLKQNAPLFKYKAAVFHADFIKNHGESVDDFVPFITTLCAGYDEILKGLGKEGKRFLWYVCCGPAYPNTFIKSELYETLFIAVFTSFLKLDGFLRWNYTVFPENPIDDIKYGTFPAGDVNFVYPSKSGKPLLSLRYKAMRYAAELFEMLCAVNDKISESEADKFYSTVIKERDITKYFTPQGAHALPIAQMMAVLPCDYDMFFDKIYEILTR